ncbi:MAG: peptide ABC transporter substrate-binding protein [Clostridiales bacterium]|jgi:oligopeptide transport system substrate-binding protein|nr:peptide ABC transporter substrate-binding protein [Clostridiales bacterium]
MKKLLRIFVTSLLVAVIALSAACRSDEGEAPEGDAAAVAGELVVNVGPNPDTIDPALNSAVDGATMIIHSFEGLYSLDQNGTPVPGQAESVDISEDGTVYTFHLREGLKWSDGSPLTANDFVYSWNRAIAPETAADYAYMFESVKGYAEGEMAVTAVDDLTLEVELIARTPYFLELAAFPVYFPVKQEIVEANADAWATSPDTYVSNGPYTMTEWVRGSYIKYVKNENYWNNDALGPDSIRFVLIEDNNASLAGYESGELKFIDAVPNAEIPRLKAQDDFKIEGQIGTYYISYNVGAEAVDDPMFRKALTLAIDRDYITTNIGQAGQVNAGAFVSTGIGDAEPGVEFREVGGDYYDPSPEAYEANLEEAKAIIAELYPDGNIPTLEYIYNEDTGHQLIGEALQQMWAEIGVEVTLQVQEWATFLNTRKNQEYQIARNGWLNDYNDPIGMLDMWITGGGNNDAGWSNAEYDALITAVKNSSDQTERMELMHQAEDLLFEEWVLCPIYYYVDVYMIDDSITNGFYSSPLGYKYFMYVEME